MTALLTPLLLGVLWAGLPLAMIRPMQRAGVTPVTAALTLFAGACATGALAMMPQEPFGILTDPERAYQDVYFILARNRYVANLCLVLFAAGGVVFLLRGLGAERLILETGHWLVHLGAGLLLLQCLPIIPMPRRYVDYPEVFYWRNLAGVVATTLCMAGTAAILLSLPAALLTRIRRA